MATNAGLELYRQKLISGEVVKSHPLTPAEKALANPGSFKHAISAKCWDCTCHQREEIKLCPMTDCSLWNFRPYK